jgi:2',3'-cyclic-nucleotide 2'-phosphodiesterase (5'-nucleotidase family)
MRGKKTALVANCVMAFIMVAAMVLGGINTAQAKESAKSVDVLFTHDMHSHINSFETIVNGSDTNIGGFARIKTIIDTQKEKNPDTLVVDGGDFSMGTLFQTVYESQASELRLLGAMGYDATTLGNHEFDYRSKGISTMLETALASKDKLPAILDCNIDWKNPNDEQKSVKKAFDDYGIKDYEVIEKNGVKIALLGVFGKDALACAPTCALKFTDPVEAVKKTVAQIKDKEKVDMIVCLSHSGTSNIKSKSEDETLAQKVPELDLIISGHSHTIINQPITYGDTAIVSAGEYGENVGSLSLVQKDNKRWQVKNYQLMPTTEKISSNQELQKKIDAYQKNINEDYLAQYGYTMNQVIAHNNNTFGTALELIDKHTEQNVGDLLADAYVYAAEHASGNDGTPVDVAVVPSGTVRDTYVKGDVTVSSVLNSFSLGIGPDGIPGYPLISLYLTGTELKTMAEIDASVTDYMPTARLYCSGLNMTFNPNRLILNKVTDVYLTDTNGKRKEIQNDKLYHVVADLYSGQMLKKVTDMSKGILSIVPKNADGTKVEDFEKCIIYNNKQELKAWVGIAEYLSSFDKNANGVSEIPAYYNETHERKVVNDDASIGSIVKNPNKYAVIIVSVVLLGIAIVIFLLVFIVKLVRRIYRKKKMKGIVSI